MKKLKVSSILFTIIFVIGALFIWLRKVDGRGAVNTMDNRIISLTVWVVLFVIILLLHMIWLYFVNKNK
ncbi:DUF3923 family protein [Lactobacillus sp. ESL0791]|uniref:DUF3923 family protein n=1 Tax=Lactobacillus sp. ESL0791 TaxID=2983234 RepID=UPI0023F81EB3|nr:DUF3923 family protein [Lactobacillus sp. ESL0791]MDF7638765.1 DUF3923 family protein [Lactobacillus sp. ESL0791]